ncbi:DMT family transporter [Virgisporangium aliadipatigenens]|uniref:DMT family transporter n=1 Tax=Virgisporangium aliadipatigenens TaxID=741659 RepID=UPI001943657A|nr:EamA family transporter [Virgisporangium aliadipatigenens]
MAWGAGAIAAQLLYTRAGLGPLAVTFWRFVGGTALLALYLRRLPRIDGSLCWTGLGLAVFQAAYYAAVTCTGVAVATVVTLGAGPVLIAVGGRLTGAERGGRTAVVLAVVGLCALVGADGSGPRPALGIALALLSAFGYAAVTLHTRRRATDADDALARASGGFAVGTVLLAPLAFAEGLLPEGGDPAVTLGLLAFLGLVPTALAYGLFFAGLTVVRATTASVVALIEPVTAAVAAVLLLGERLSRPAVLGTVMLLTAVLVQAREERQ